MGTIADKLAHLSETKSQIRSAIVQKGVEVPDGTAFREYAELISAIPQSGGEPPVVVPPAADGVTQLNIAYGNLPPDDTSMLWVQATKPEHVEITWAGLGAGCEVADHGAVLSAVAKGVSSVAVGEKIYLFGGYTTGAVYLDTIQVFNTATGLLTTLDTKLPHGKAYAACALVEKKIYIIGGYKRVSADVNVEFEKAIMVFDTETESLTTLETEFPGYHKAPCCGVQEKEIYVFMGTTTHIYNTEDQTFRTGKALARDLSYATAVSYGKKIFIVSGNYYSSGYDAASSYVYIYDTETQNYTVADNNIPYGRAAAAVAAIGNMVYLLGGEYYSTTDKEYKKDSRICTLNMDTLETNYLSLTLPVQMAYGTAAAVGMKVYVFGGDTGTVLKKTIYEFSENTPLPSGNMKIRTGTDGPVFSLINTEECKVDMTVKGVYVGNENGLAEVTPAYLHDGSEWTSIWGA